jgi:hypothetical protein
MMKNILLVALNAFVFYFSCVSYGQICRQRIYPKVAVSHLTSFNKVSADKNGLYFCREYEVFITSLMDNNCLIKDSSRLKFDSDSALKWKVKISSNSDTLFLIFSNLQFNDTHVLYFECMPTFFQINDCIDFMNFSIGEEMGDMFFTNAVFDRDDLLIYYNTDTASGKPYACYQLRLSKSDFKIRSLITYNVYNGIYWEFSKEIFIYNKFNWIFRKRFI